MIINNLYLDMYFIRSIFLKRLIFKHDKTLHIIVYINQKIQYMKNIHNVFSFIAYTNAYHKLLTLSNLTLKSCSSLLWSHAVLWKSLLLCSVENISTILTTLCEDPEKAGSVPFTCTSTALSCFILSNKTDMSSWEDFLFLLLLVVISSDDSKSDTNLHIKWSSFDSYFPVAYLLPYLYQAFPENWQMHQKSL